MKFNGYNTAPFVNGTVRTLKAGILLMQEIEVILTDGVTPFLAKSEIVYDKFWETDLSTLHQALKLYDCHLKNGDPSITAREKEMTAYIMAIIECVVRQRSEN